MVGVLGIPAANTHRKPHYLHRFSIDSLCLNGINSSHVQSFARAYVKAPDRIYVYFVQQSDAIVGCMFMGHMLDVSPANIRRHSRCASPSLGLCFRV